MQISVVICTHNPNPVFINRVLAALKAQTLPREHWELLLMDNASREPLASSLDLSWHPHAQLIREEKIGKNYALLTAFGKVKGDLIVIVDDDNVLDPGYLETALQLERNHSHLGVWGGSCIAEFEVQPPTFLEKYMNRLAISVVAQPRWSNSYSDFEAIPAGAGMVIRRTIAERYKSVVTECKIRQGLGRTGKSLAACEDTDLAWTAIDMGFSAGRFPELKLTHLIPRRRVEPDYILALIEGDATSRVLLDHARKQSTFPGEARTRLIRKLWLRLRLPEFDYRAQNAVTAGIQRGISVLESASNQGGDLS